MKFLSAIIICSFSLQLHAQYNIPADSSKIFKLQSPDTFKAKFTTSKGDFIIEVYRAWSPLGADRLYQLIQTNYYSNIFIFRATQKYVQFGISNDKKINSFWDKHPIPDEPVLQTNADSIVSFATGGPDNRSAQIFVNMRNNPKLDTVNHGGAITGFPPIGKLIEGMSVVRQFNSQYGDEITFKHQDSVYKYGNDYLQKNFPGLDVILNAKIIE